MFSKRIDRIGFLVGSAILMGPIVLTLGLYFALFYSLGGSDASGASIFHGLVFVVVFFLWLVWAILLMPIYFGLMIRRLHDMDLSGWLSILHLVPVVDIALYLVLLVYPGTSGRNHYGNPQAPRTPQTILFGKKYLQNRPINPAEMKAPPIDIPPPR